MLLAGLFQNQILDDFFLGNFKFNFVWHVNLISCYFCDFLYVLNFVRELVYHGWAQEARKFF